MTKTYLDNDRACTNLFEVKIVLRIQNCLVLDYKMSKEQKDRKPRKTYPGVNQADNVQMLQDIRETLAAHHRENDVRKSVTPSPVTVRETATPSPSAELTSPGSFRTKARPSPVDFDRQRHHHAQMAKIRDSLKPHHRSDPGFGLSTDMVNPEMLQDLLMKGYDQVN